MLKFKNCPYRNRPYMGNNTQWIVDIYQKYFQNKTDGFLVEIGVISLEIIQCTLPKEYIFIGTDDLNAAFVHSDFYIA